MTADTADYTFEYDRETDFLTITNTATQDEAYKLTLHVGEVAVNVSHQKHIMSVDVANASQIFDISPETLKHLDTVNINVEHRENFFVVTIKVIQDETASQYGVQFDPQHTGSVTA